MLQEHVAVLGCRLVKFDYCGPSSTKVVRSLIRHASAQLAGVELTGFFSVCSVLRGQCAD